MRQRIRKRSILKAKGKEDRSFFLSTHKRRRTAKGADRALTHPPLESLARSPPRSLIMTMKENATVARSNSPKTTTHGAFLASERSRSSGPSKRRRDRSSNNAKRSVRSMLAEAERTKLLTRYTRNRFTCTTYGAVAQSVSQSASRTRLLLYSRHDKLPSPSSGDDVYSHTQVRCDGL